MTLSTRARDFEATRLGVIVSPQAGQPHEVWGVLNPGGTRGPDEAMHLFPRLIAEGNYSRIGHAVVRFDGGLPDGVDRLGVALEPHEAYEVGPGGGGVEDARVVYIPLLKRYVMTYTAFVPYEPRVAVAVSADLERPSRVLYRTPLPILEPKTDYERSGLVGDVIFPSATDLRADGSLDVYYGAADRVIAAARITLPDSLPQAPPR